MSPNTAYTWEIETSDGRVFRQYDEHGNEQTWKAIEIDRIVRVSMMPSLPLLPQHDCFIDASKGEQFIKRFGRGFIKQTPEGFKLKEYVNCIVTNRYRLWVLSSGKAVITNNEQEVYI